MEKLNRRQLAAGLLAASQAGAATTLPNLVFILSDDHSVPFMGAYGDPVIQTPNLDRFAREGMRLDKMFTAAPQCVPSRTAFLTGRSPVACRMGRFTSPLPADIPTLPELLRRKGYFTGVCRRWFHLDGPANPGPVSTKIFDEHGVRTWDKRVDWLDKNSRRDQTEAKINEFLDKAPKHRPFFLWVNFNDPHHVWDRDAIPKPHDPKKLRVPAYLPDLPGVRDDLGRYSDEVARMDSEFQTVLNVLENRGFKENTLIIFMGDNGLAFPHGKGSLYDPGLNVPCLARWPGKIKPGTSSAALASGEDVTPTFLDAAGLSPLPAMSGKSLLPLFTGKTDKHREYIFAARNVHGGATFTAETKANSFDLSRCVRNERYKLIFNCTPQMEYWPVDSAADPGWQDILKAHQAGKLKPEHERIYFGKRAVLELYDLQADPNEFHNLAGKPEYAAIQRQLGIALQEKMILDYDYLPLPYNE
ncbi:MAG: sulfatase [Bryobacteraceae bacterium]